MNSRISKKIHNNHAAIRLASPADAAEIAAIYAPAVTDGFISFEETPPDAAEIAARMTAGLAVYPWLVFEEHGQVLGYAYAGRHQARAAYRWSVDVTVYVRADAHRRGIGRDLYRSLFDILRRQGFRMAHAGIALPNPGSVGLHEALGFERVGVYRNVGWKSGAWRDVGWWALDLGAATAGAGAPPPEPVAFARLDPRRPASGA
jgi:phosphinothricin acetyltransferase